VTSPSVNLGMESRIESEAMAIMPVSEGDAKSSYI
jgi:hypothetical protein